jgi:micrococcal nuclease
MNPKQKNIILLVSLIIALFLINYPFLDDKLESFLNMRESVHVDRVIDGDTIESNKTSIRLLGINSPERGEQYYDEAKEFLEELILNETVNLQYGKERYDKYDRILAYIYINRENINLRVVEEGFANYYFPKGKDQHYQEFVLAWESCINNSVNLCEASQHSCSKCISVNPNNIINTCSFSCDITGWQIKGEGREIFVFPDKVLKSGDEISFELEITETGDTLFLRDAEGKLVLWESY